MATSTIAPPTLSAAAATSRPPVPAATLRALTGVVHLTLALMLLQAVLAGVFVSDTYAKSGGGDGWVTAHGVVADVIWVLALAGAGLAVAKLRRRVPVLTGLSVAYFVLAIAETGIGHLITDGSVAGISGGGDGLIALHIPLAIVIFALGGLLAVRIGRLRTA